ncbi:tripartite tricarboxylate transporter TctB family protein [Microvirga sp. M2]|uniref:tripartite tricarboxylate transporter TctB family protein n=1 Tax=Microvirga sp. M2 TaxID=3073270 RepID=UPI0039C3D69B
MRYNRTIIVCAVGLAVIYLYATLQIPSRDDVDPLGPRAYPLLVFAGMMVSAAWIFIEGHRSEDSIEVSEAKEDLVVGHRHTALIGALVAWCIGYFAVLEHAGFIVSTLMFLLGLTTYFNRGRHLANVTTCIAFPVGIYLMFTKVLGVPLPSGLVAL